MTDDIVTRLREGCPECGPYLCADTHEAADEIERLRNELAHARSEVARLERLAING